MTRENTAARVRDLAGPLGAFRSFDQQSRETDAWLNSMGAGAVAELVDLFLDPPGAAELGGFERDDVSQVVDELLCRVATMRPIETVPALVAYLDDQRARPYVADALAAAGTDEAREALAGYLAAHPGLSPEETVPLREAVAEIDARSQP
jgi:hypothetical protein